MSEIDFDELDKAVNTLMNDVPNTAPSKADDTKTLNISSTLPDSTRPSLDELNSALTQVNSSAAKPVAASAASTPPLAARRGGRFMDVVHPSSDMKGVAKPASVPSRQGVTIQPSPRPVATPSDDTHSHDTSEAPVVSAVGPVLNEKVAALGAHETPAGQTITKDEWPDPLEMSGYSAEPDTAATNTEVPASVVEDQSDDKLDATPLAGDTVDDEVQPLTSPFITDAKVEKRPLGGATPSEANVQSEELSHSPVLGALTTDAETDTKAQDQLPANPAAVEQQLPPELQSDLMAIEADGGTATVAPEVEETPETPQPVSKPLETVATPVRPVSVTGPTSIPQQYHEEPSTSDQSNGSIYDTASYHQPLAHPVKSKSGWLWVLWILLLLIIGGGGAAALYFFDII